MPVDNVSLIVDNAPVMAILTLPNADARSLTVRAKALVFEDVRSRTMLERIRQVAPSEATVLIIGETGTGKEIVARHIHELSPRAGQPFVAVNCGAFPESLVESELFGHERGAFTGATATKPGWFEAAQGGTLFLDEIGDLPPSVQVKLLRVLQEREVVRLGSRQPIAIDVRLVAATNVNLDQAVAAGRFREDLFYRLGVAILSLPPLRERPGDILPLAAYFLRLYGQRLSGVPAALSAEAEARLLAHGWPGNIRELENVIHSALLVARGPAVQADDLPLRDLPARVTPAGPDPLEALRTAMVALFDRNLPDLHGRVEETLFRTAYRYCHRNQLQTARLLGISRNVVRARLLDLGELPAPARPGVTFPGDSLPGRGA
jgi:sigma-54-specific transcriptional regulator